jgi:hypothetical protein
MSKRPLKATDKRRNRHVHKPVESGTASTGQGAPLANLFNNRKRKNGDAKRAG